MQSIVYHPQPVAVYHQAAGGYTFGDDIRLAAMIYTLKRDDIPSLAAWIKKEVTFVYQKLLLFWRAEEDSNP